MSEEAQYRRAVVSFIDVLGFRQLVSSATVPEILAVLQRKNSLTLHWMPDQEPIEGTTFTFSDLIVNVTPLSARYPLHSLFNQFVELGFRQFHLATSGVFVRGGIAVGDIYVDKQTIFGPALITAYDLERVTAKWPIIALDPALITDIDLMATQYIANRREREGDNGELLSRLFLAQLRDLIRITDDGVHFLDYIACFAVEDSATGDLSYYLKDHQESLLEAHRKHRHWKYPFLAQYHDSYCRRYFGNDSNLIVGDLI